MDILEEVTRVRKDQTTAPTLVDVTRFTARSEDNPLVFQWVSPSVCQVYRIGSDAAELLKDIELSAGWDESLALDVATLAWCHHAPSLGETPKGRFYAAIANSNPEMFFYLITRLQQAFPHLKGDARDQNVLIDLCSQYYSRHPEELAHLPSHILSELKRLSEAKAAKSVVI